MSKQIPPNCQQQFIEYCSHKRNYGKAMFFLRSTENSLANAYMWARYTSLDMSPVSPVFLTQVAVRIGLKKFPEKR